ncbi:hypothetical protein VE03_03369 [Pseudogymnoascus sp. 23342-1-I1]|nr:hypothetical protein VE03_03369 [Pseudogymnoascus sp. 23342-1-I1]
MIAANDVFATFELLEAILLYAPPFDLLLSVAVSRTWHQTILSSNPLQQRLFFAPAPADTPWTQNPILAAKFWPIFHDDRYADVLAEKLRAECRGPCLYGHIPPIRYPMAGPPCKGPHCRNVRCQGAVEGFSAADQDAYLRPEASWRKTLAMQPPVKMLRILQYGFSQENPRGEDEKRLGPRRVMQMSQSPTLRAVFAQAGPTRRRRARGVIQWDMWDVVTATGEDERSQVNETLYVIEGEEGMDRHTLVYVDWWMDRNGSAINNGGEEEVAEIRRMAGMDIVSGQ